MTNRISHSAVRTYATCGRKYFYHYNQRLRAPVISGALLFGSAIDSALNDLLLTKDVENAKKIFFEMFTSQKINGVETYLPRATNVVYAAKDFDAEIIRRRTPKGFVPTETIQKQYDSIIELKETKGFNNLTNGEKETYTHLNWDSMYEKGIIMIDTYAKEILPQVKQVLAIQRNISLKNNQGDEIIGVVDLIVEWKDGKRYILDNKTSTREYDQDAPMRSQQLLLYHHICKEEYKIDGGIGFIVLYKQLQKNRKKVCSKCGFNGSGGRHKTCSNTIRGPSLATEEYVTADIVEKRCNGEWKETIDPKARIEVILNQAPEAAEELVLDAFDSANEGIQKRVFNPNLEACGTGDWSCQFKKLCWLGKDESLVKLEEGKR